MKRIVSRVRGFVTRDIWRIRARDLPRAKSFFIRQLRILVLSVRGFFADRCHLRASALTFYTLMAVVPVVALAFGIAKGFGFEEMLERRLLEEFHGQEGKEFLYEVVTRVIAFAKSLLENVRGGLVAGIGVAVLFWAVVKILGSTERAFNDIWGIKKSRAFVRKLTDYLFVVLVCPVLLIIASSVSVIVTRQVTSAVENIAVLEGTGLVILIPLRVLSFCVMWLLFAFLYIFLPNTRVNHRSGILAAILAGTLFQVLQWVCITAQIVVTRYNAVYGSFSALPLFLIWLQTSWLIVLFGAEFAFAHQNVETYEFEPDCLRISYSFRKLLSLRVAHLLVKRFAVGLCPVTAAQVSHETEIPIRLVNQILYELTEAGVASEIGGGDYKDVGYQPARAIDGLTVNYVVEALERRGTDNLPVARSQELARLSESLKGLHEAVENSPANLLLRDL